MVSIGTWGLHVDDGKDGAYGRQQQLKSMATVDAALSRVHAISQEAAATSAELLGGVEGRLSQVSSEASRAYAAASRAENLATSSGTKLAAIEQQTAEKVEALEAKVDAATFTDAAQATDATVATFITNAQSKTSAALTTAFVQDGDGVWRADKNGFIKIAEPAKNQPANAENAAKNSALWIALRNKVILAGGGIIEFGAGLYEFESMPFDIDIPGYTPKANNELNLTVQGTGGYGTLLRLTKAGYGGAAMPIGKLSYGEGSVRSVRLKDLSVVANAKWGIPDRANFQGIRVEHTSNIDFENLRVAGFGRGGFYSINAWDSSWKNVEFLYCGTANETGQPTDEAPYNAYAVEFIGQGSGSTNAFHIDALRIEQAPLMLKVGPMGRLIDFSNSKFEHGHNPKSLNKTATLAPIRIDGAIEVSFTGCKFTASQSSGQQTPYKPFVQTIPLGIEDYTSRGYRSMIKFSACDFFANTATKQKWFEGSDTIFTSCSFSRADGQDYPFRLKDNNIFDACTVGSVNSYIRMFTLVGKNNRIKNCSLYSGYPNGQYAAPFDVVSGATNNEITGNIFINQDIKWLTSESPRFLGSNRFSIPANRVVTVADGGGSDSVLGAEIVRLPAVASTQWTGFNNGWNGQRITVVARADRTELHHGNRIRNRGAVNLFLSAGDSVSYTCLDDIWYQS
ncbi:hypothetical protein [Rothia nasimurium]|uniref:hypothetical protein n=1 Tax=Rothia nasimurium TaxID=85336 RepID=UPI001F163B3C|nr:hypothetical protein [Rothia nasimurium]